MPIEFVGFTNDHRITGQIPLADDRLSDMLNAVARVVVRSGVTEELDGERVDPGDVTLLCGDLFVVAGTGRRGLESQRRRTLTRRVRVGIGRYVVEGLLHFPPAAHAASFAVRPEDLMIGRDLLVPLTEATMSYERAGKRAEEHWDTLLVNRARVTWIEATDALPQLDEDRPEDAAERLARARYAKDFTGTPTG